MADVPTSCVRDIVVYAALCERRALTSPVSIPGRADLPELLGDLPYGAFAQLVRATVDPLWGGYSQAPEQWDELNQLLEERGEGSLWDFDPHAEIAREARLIYDHGRRHGGARPSMAAMLSAMSNEIRDHGWFGEE